MLGPGVSISMHKEPPKSNQTLLPEAASYRREGWETVEGEQVGPGTGRGWGWTRQATCQPIASRLLYYEH